MRGLRTVRACLIMSAMCNAAWGVRVCRWVSASCSPGRARTGVVGADRHALRVVECCLLAATVHKAIHALLTGLGVHIAGSPIDRLDDVVACVAHVDPAIFIAPR